MKSKTLVIFFLFISTLAFAQFTEYTINNLPSGYRYLFNYEDYNNDGLIDIMNTTNDQNINIYYGNCEGGFDNVVQFPTVDDPHTKTTIIANTLDINSDCVADLILHSYANSSASVLRYTINDENNTGFPEFIELFNPDGPISKKDANIIDYDSDGLNDLIVVDTETGTFYFCKNLVNGLLAPPIIIHQMEYQLYLSSLVMDMDDDGDIDILVKSNTHLTILTNNNENGFDEAKIIFPSNDPFFDLEFKDMDSDGDIDIILPLWASNKLKWLENNGANGFITTPNFIPGNLGQLRQVIITDVDVDGYIDIVGQNANGIYWWKNLGNDVFSSQTMLWELNDQIDRFEAIDFDNDGDEDLIFMETDANMHILFNQTLSPETNIHYNISCTEHLKCPEDNSGSINISFTSCRDYSITWQNNSLAGFNVNNLSQGNYVFTITDNDTGLSLIDSIYLSEPAPISIEVLNTSIAHVGQANGSIEIEIGGGVGEYQFEWLNSQGAFVSDSISLNEIESDTYTVIVTDENGCSITENIEVGENPLFLSEVSFLNSTCFESNDGRIEVFVNGGTAPYSYQLNSLAIQTSSLFESLTPNEYSILITDSEGFTIETSVQISEPQLLTAVADVFGSTINVIPNGGTLPYSYTIDGINYIDSPVFTEVPGGEYTLTILDVNGCIFNTNLEVEQNNLTFNNSQLTPVTCFEVADGTISIDVQNNVLPTMYSIDYWSSQQVTPYFDNLDIGEYHVKAIDANGFELTSPLLIITQPDLLSASINVSVNNITITPSGGTPPYSFSVDGGPSQVENTFNGLAIGIHSVIIEDSNGCSKTVQSLINTTPVNEIIENDAISLYPNPSKGQFQLCNRSNQLVTGRLSLYNFVGELLFIENIQIQPNSTHSVYTNNYPSGLYQAVIQEQLYITTFKTSIF